MKIWIRLTVVRVYKLYLLTYIYGLTDTNVYGTSYGKLVTKYPSIYGHFYSAGQKWSSGYFPSNTVGWSNKKIGPYGLSVYWSRIGTDLLRTGEKSVSSWTATRRTCYRSMTICLFKPAFHDTDTDILATILARLSVRMSMSMSLHAAFTGQEAARRQ